MPTGMTRLEANDLALKLARFGLYVFPIALSRNPQKGTVDKKPLTKHGHHDATIDLSKIETDFLTARLGPGQEIGVGIVPGLSGLMVLDVDIKGERNGVTDLLDLQETLGELPPTKTVVSASKGFHYWFEKPTSDPIGNFHYTPAVEVRSDAGWIVAPGTVTPWGEWITQAGGVPFDQIPTLPEGWARQLLRKDVPEPNPQLKTGTPVTDADREMAYSRLKEMAAWLATQPEGSGRNGKLNNCGYAMGRLLHHGLNHQDAFTALIGAAKDNGYIAKDGLQAAEATLNGALNQGYAAGPEPDFGQGPAGLILPKKERKPSTLIKVRGQTIPEGVNYNDIHDSTRKTFPPRLWVVEKLVPAGLTLLIGASKVGKSFFAAKMACAIATGQDFLGFETKQGAILYLALEDDEQGFAERAKQFGGLDIAPGQLISVTGFFPPFDRGGIEELEKWLDTRPDTQAIFIDTIGRVRGALPGKDRYAEEYALYGGLQRWALDKDIALVLLHHTNKGKHDDFLDRASGTMGVAGSADSYLDLSRERGREEGVLRTTSRFTTEVELALKFDKQSANWTSQGDLWEHEIYVTRKAVLDAISEAGGEADLPTILQNTGISRRGTESLLKRMVADNTIRRVRRGFYASGKFSWDELQKPGPQVDTLPL